MIINEKLRATIKNLMHRFIWRNKYVKKIIIQH